MDQAFSLDALFEAIIFAARKHQGQVRKDEQASPYVTHPLTVARLIHTTGKVSDQTVLIAAILHDTLEDTDTQPDEIQTQFGADVLEIVLAVTDDKSLKKDCRKQLQVKHAPHLTFPARMIKLADKLANCHDILHSPPKDWSLTRRQEYVQWSADVIAQIRGTNQPLEAAFAALLSQAESILAFQLKPFATINNRKWGPQAEDQCQ